MNKIVAAVGMATLSLGVLAEDNVAKYMWDGNAGNLNLADSGNWYLDGTQGGEKQLIYAVTKRTVPVGKLPADVGVVVVNIDTATGKPVIKWNAVSGAASYKVAYCTTKDGEYKLLKDTTGTSVTHTGAVAGTKYYSSWSTSKSIKIKKLLLLIRTSQAT